MLHADFARKTIHKMGLLASQTGTGFSLYNKMENLFLNNDYKMARLYNDELDSIILKYPSIKPTVNGDTARIYVLNINYRQGNIEALILLDSLVLLYRKKIMIHRISIT